MGAYFLPDFTKTCGIQFYFEPYLITLGDSKCKLAFFHQDPRFIEAMCSFNFLSVFIQNRLFYADVVMERKTWTRFSLSEILLIT